MKRILFFVLTILMGGVLVHAQTVPALDAIKSQEELTRAITTLDAELFAAYNTCDLEKFGSLIDENIEFYHDKGGLAVGKKALVEGIKNNICGKVTRELVAGSLEVYPIAHYGAVEIGVHRFLHPWTQDHGVVGEAKFIHLWQYKEGAWRVTRVISFDHEAAK
jgi:Domain of unknown function (DUF4440)